MKIKTVETKHKFVPVTIELTIESEEELKFFWHLFNCSLGKVRKAMSDFVDDFDTNVGNTAGSQMFRVVDDIVKNRNMRNP